MTLRRINMAPRAALFFSAILLIVIILGVVAVRQMDALRASEQDVETNWMASMRLAGLMNSGLLRLRLEALRGTTTPDAKLRQKTIEDFTVYINSFFDTVKKYANVVASDEERKLYQDVLSSSTQYESLLSRFEPLLKSGDNAAAVSLINSEIRPVTNKLQEQIVALRDYNDRGAQAAGVLATEIYNTGKMLVCGLIAATVLLTVALAYLLVRSIKIPINEALLVAERIAQKDLSQKLNIVGQDEASRLLTSLAKMQDNLKLTVEHIIDSSAQLASASEEMSAVTDEASRGLVRQNDEVNQAATAVTEMSAAVDEVARNAAEAAEASNKTQTLTEAGQKNVSRTLTAIKHLTGNVQMTSEQVKTLSLRAQEISKVVDVIRAIAEQTNLLALNAAIEAARAGEQGRGFAVVADEVRALAHRTQQSTQEIEAMIGSIQTDTVETVRAMENSQKMADESSIVAQDASSSLEQISTAITVINERNALIATAAEEQAQVAREIDRNLTSIRDLSTQSSAGATQTAIASGEVSKLAVGLKREVSVFITS